MATRITSELRKRGQGARQGHRPSAQDEFGVYNQDLRELIRAFKKQIATENGRFVYQLALALLDRNVTECRKVAYELIAAHREARELLTVKRIEALGAGLDNWACVDSFCCVLVGEAWRTGRLSDSTIMRWSRSKDLWWRRAAVVATVPLNMKSRRGTGDPRRTLLVCEALVSDPEVMVQKAISWALRQLVPWDRAAVEQFLKNHGNQVSALVRREVLRKLETGRKN